MKGMSGLEVCRRLRAIDELRGIPIILISAFAEQRMGGGPAGGRLGLHHQTVPDRGTPVARQDSPVAETGEDLGRTAGGSRCKQANTRLQLELVERERVEASLRRILERAERSRRAMLSILEDKTRSDAALREQARLLSESQRLGHVGSWFLDLAGPIAWSEETYQIYGVSPDTFVPTASRCSPSSILTTGPACRRGSRPAWQGASPPNWSFASSCRTAPIRHAMGRGDAVRDVGGRISHIAGTVQDITERKLADAQKAKLESDLRQIQKMESVGRLAGGVAHDFNNMLGVILGMWSWRSGRCRRTRRSTADLTEIHNAAASLGRPDAPVARLRPQADRRAQSPGPEPDRGPDALKMLRRLIGENIDLRWLPKADLWPVNVDPAQVDQILTNLCLNARDAISGVGTITIETENATLDEAYCDVHPGFVAGDYASLAVSDDGCGMDQGTTVACVRTVLHDQSSRARAPASVWRRSTASSSRTADSSTSTASRITGRPSGSTCPATRARPCRRRPRDGTIPSGSRCRAGGDDPAGGGRTGPAEADHEDARRRGLHGAGREHPGRCHRPGQRRTPAA